MEQFVFKRMGFVVLSALVFILGCSNDDSDKNRCDLEPDVGVCNAYMPRYYFDKKENKCKEFIWGGCGGVVPFETMEECKACLTQG